MIGLSYFGKVCQEIILHIMAPLSPAWTVKTRHVGSINSCQILPYHVWLSKIRIHQTRLHFSNVQLYSFCDSVLSAYSAFCFRLTELEPDVFFFFFLLLLPIRLKDRMFNILRCFPDQHSVTEWLSELL